VNGYDDEDEYDDLDNKYNDFIRETKERKFDDFLQTLKQVERQHEYLVKNAPKHSRPNDTRDWLIVNIGLTWVGLGLNPSRSKTSRMTQFIAAAWFDDRYKPNETTISNTIRFKYDSFVKFVASHADELWVEAFKIPRPVQ